MVRRSNEWVDRYSPVASASLKASLWLVALATFVVAGLHAIDGEWKTTLSALAVAVSAALLAQLDRMARFSLTLKGVEADLRRTAQEAEVKLAQVQKLAESVVVASLGQFVRAEYLRPWRDEELERERDRLCDSLRVLGSSEARIREVLDESWHPPIRKAYGRRLLGLSLDVRSHRKNPEFREEWKALARKPLDAPATAAEIEAFIEKWGFGCDFRREGIEDLRHYERTGTHRRPEVWAMRYKIRPDLNWTDETYREVCEARAKHDASD
ncbi:MAG: hypothetical protein JNL80_00230 [Phycisphaerae bacterium]|nr:hypothetical protein [Phycisphaerae bacterium]